ncbi:NERD domain-containing protein [Tumebacillus flagellatus]|uniref:NERD domain-containing protein n=1 Tax=Tumebacillus flagellatus TaxID=1157490 RepID=A0A074M9L9_9BACL|nr:NERD domain-containing protein [Tumebacillus flagellatus]KEO82622.1 hypothetical protein EL26_14655 [Tumebacillus flagellatus]
MFLLFFILLLIVCVPVLLQQRKRSQRRKGVIGEKLVRKELSRLDGVAYRSLHNLLLPRHQHEPGQQDKTTQIDHVIVSLYGIFVLETKDYGGTIYGDDRRAQWTQYLGSKKSNFKNPLHQNYGHVQALKHLLHDMGEIKMFNFVVFTGRAKLKIETAEDTDGEIFSVLELHRAIAKYKQPVLTPVQVAQIEERLKAANLDNRHTRKQHVQTIQAEKAAQEAKLQAGECPKCGSPLVDRQGKYGPFKGCSSYPKCR